MRMHMGCIFSVQHDGNLPSHHHSPTSHFLIQSSQALTDFKAICRGLEAPDRLWSRKPGKPLGQFHPPQYNASMKASLALGFTGQWLGRLQLPTNRSLHLRWQKAEDQVLFGDLMMWAWLFRGNPMPKKKSIKKLGVAKRFETVKIRCLKIAHFRWQVVERYSEYVWFSG